MDLDNPAIQLDDINVQMMRDFIDRLNLSEDHRKFDRRVQELQDKKKANVRRFLDGKYSLSLILIRIILIPCQLYQT